MVNITDPDGHSTALAALRGSVARREGTGASYDIALGVEGLALSTPFLRAAEGTLPDTFQDARLQAQMSFDQPWELAGLSGDRPRPTALDLTLARLEWGPMALKLTGDMEINRKGWIEGDLHIRAENWREMLRVARKSGEVPERRGRWAGGASGPVVDDIGRRQDHRRVLAL